MMSRASLLFAVMLATAGRASGATDVADSLASAARSLRLEGQLTDALAAAERGASILVARGASDSGMDALSQSLADARREISTLQILLDLPDNDRQAVLDADALSRLLVMHVARGEFTAARSIVAQQLATKRRILGEDHYEVALLFNSLAAFDHAEGDFGEAEHLLREASFRSRRALGPQHTTVLTIMQNLASTLRDRGEWDESERLYRQVLELLERRYGSQHLEVATTLGSLAELLHDDGDLEEAEALLRRALATYRELVGEQHERTGETLLRLGRVQVDQGRLREAEVTLDHALEILRTILGPAHPRTAEAMLHLGDLLLRRGETSRAEEYAVRALEIIRAGRGRSHPDVVAALRVAARARWARGDSREAAARLAEACEVYEAARLRAGEGLVRSTFFDSPYAECAALLLSRGEEDAAWQAMARHHGRGLVDLLRASAAAHTSSAEAARGDSLRRRIARLERQLVAQDVSERGNLRDQLLAAEAAWSTLQRSIAQRNPLVAASLSLSRVQAALDPKHALVGWLDVDPPGVAAVHWAFVLRFAGRARWVRIDVDDEPHQARDLRRALVTAGGWPVRLGFDAGLERRLAGLWKQRVAPLLPMLADVDHLVVLPSGEMLGVPVECLVDDAGRFLADRWTVSYTPSPSFLVWMRERRDDHTRDGRRSALVVADPPLRDDEGAAPPSLRGLPRLVHSRDEALRVAAAFDDPRVLIGSDASEQELWHLANTDRLREFRVLHIATHALIDDRRPERSALVLSQKDLPDQADAVLRGEPTFDGIVTAHEIAREWRIDADLVTLSACRSGGGRRIVGEGFLGLTHAFLQVGASSVLSSLWTVDDVATSELMMRFYENLTGDFHEDRGDGAGVPFPAARALGEARTWLREYRDAEGGQPFAHPVYWAGFVLITGLP